MNCCSMSFFLLLGLVVFVVVSVWGNHWLELWAARRQGDAPTETVAALDAEIAALQERVHRLEGAGGSGTWMASFALRRHRRRLEDLCQRRQRLIEACQPWLRAPRGSEEIQQPPEPLRPVDPPSWDEP